MKQLESKESGLDFPIRTMNEEGKKCGEMIHTESVEYYQ
jgi:hypothetical protein